jgi:glycosyltransferase involved in cell wall biosynthesis
MRIILIGNYPPDRQESMERFAQMLHAGFQQVDLDTTIWRPGVLFGRPFRHTKSGLGKWLGYIDKWLLFPLQLRWRVGQLKRTGEAVRFHVCDHSNAPYLAHLPADQTGITCHDVLAIRGAMGYADAHCPASGFGKLLQRWILHYLSRAQNVACVSDLTRRQLEELAGTTSAERPGWRVIHNTFNGDFWPMDTLTARQHLREQGIALPGLFVLHVGSDMARKNRAMLLTMVAQAGTRWNGAICFAGAAIDDELRVRARELGLEDRLVAVTGPDHTTLVALYSACDAFVFPSFSEGFGWPLIEAQACGAPVIASDVEPMPEVSGGAALHAPPTDAAAFARALLTLQQGDTRADYVQRGLTNATRFAPETIMHAYLRLHNLTSVSIA